MVKIKSVIPLRNPSALTTLCSFMRHQCKIQPPNNEGNCELLGLAMRMRNMLFMRIMREYTDADADLIHFCVKVINISQNGRRAGMELQRFQRRVGLAGLKGTKWENCLHFFMNFPGEHTQPILFSPKTDPKKLLAYERKVPPTNTNFIFNSDALGT